MRITVVASVNGIEDLKKALAEPTEKSTKAVFRPDPELKAPVEKIKIRFGLSTDYDAYQYLQLFHQLKFLSEDDRSFIQQVAQEHQFFPAKFQGAETIQRYEFIQDLLNKVIIRHPDQDWKKRTYALDRILTHKIFGLS